MLSRSVYIFGDYIFEKGIACFLKESQVIGDVLINDCKLQELEENALIILNIEYLGISRVREKIAATRKLLKVQIMIFYKDMDPRLIEELIDMNVHGIIGINTKKDELISCINCINQGGTYLDANAHILIKDTLTHRVSLRRELNETELKILEFILIVKHILAR